MHYKSDSEFEALVESYRRRREKEQRELKKLEHVQKTTGKCFVRHLPFSQRRRRGYCTGCGNRVPKGRLYWCSKACCEAYGITRSASQARDAVLRRDHGRCAECGENAEELAAYYNRLHLPAEDLRARLKREGFTGAHIRQYVYVTEPRERCTDPLYYHHHLVGMVDTLWHTAHIVAVSEGGGTCGLANLKTLCLRCHAEETAELRTRLKVHVRKQNANSLGRKRGIG